MSWFNRRPKVSNLSVADYPKSAYNAYFEVIDHGDARVVRFYHLKGGLLSESTFSDPDDQVMDTKVANCVESFMKAHKV